MGQVKVVDVALFSLVHVGLGAKGDLDPDKDRPEFPGHTVEQLPHTGLNMLAGMLVPSLHFHSKGQSGVGHEVAEVGMGRPSPFLGVVAFHCPFLGTIQRFDRVVGVDNPGGKRNHRMAPKRLNHCASGKNLSTVKVIS